MTASEPPPPPDSVSPAEQAEQREAERRGEPYLLYRDHSGRRRVFCLPDAWDHAAIGRSMNADLIVGWDAEVSAIHAELKRLGDDWVLIDDGMSRNGSFVNGERVRGRRRLAHGDELRLGHTSLAFHAPFQIGQQTVVSADVELPPSSPGEAPQRD
jgi:hypothetical protein